MLHAAESSPYTALIQDVGLDDKGRAITLAGFFLVRLRLEVDLPNFPAQDLNQGHLEDSRPRTH